MIDYQVGDLVCFNVEQGEFTKGIYSVIECKFLGFMWIREHGKEILKVDESILRLATQEEIRLGRRLP